MERGLPGAKPQSRPRPHRCNCREIELNIYQGGSHEHRDGASAPLKELQQKFGFEPDQVVTAAKEQLKKA